MGYTEKAKEVIKSNTGDDDELNATIRNAAVGLTPVLMNFLSNRSAQMQARGFEKSNKFTQGLAEEKGTEVLDENGVPVIMPEGEAMFRQPYHKPEKSTLADPSNVQSSHFVYNKRTGQSQLLTQLRDRRIGFEVPGEGFVQIDPRDLEKDYGIGTSKAKNPKNEITTTQYRKNNPSDKTVLAKDKSLATHMGVETEAEAEARIKQAEEGQKTAEKLERDDTNLKSGLNIALTTQDGMSFATETFGAIKKALNDGKMSDNDVRNALGEDYTSIFDSAGNLVSGKIKGKVPEGIRKKVVNLFKNAINKNKAELEKVRSIGGRSSDLTKSGKGTIESIIPQQDKESFEQKKNRLKSL